MVGLQTGGAESSATDGARDWARENELDYYEIKLDAGSSVEDMLVELVRSARILTEKPADMLEEMYAQEFSRSGRRSSTTRLQEVGASEQSPRTSAGCAMM